MEQGTKNPITAKVGVSLDIANTNDFFRRLFAIRRICVTFVTDRREMIL
jgi:hypothetical protein